MAERILITGGAGFIGSHLAHRCLTLGHEVVVVDNLSTGASENLPAGAEFVELDISREEDYRKIHPFDFDAVFHLAAQSSGEISSENPALDLTVNTLGTLLLLRRCQKAGVKRFLYSSSMAVYGNPERQHVDETDECRPLSFYGISKLAAEHYILHYIPDGLEPTIFRLFSVYGPGQNLANLKQGMVSIYMAYLMKGEPVRVKGSGDRFRDFIYIDDVLDAWMGALDTPATRGRIYNLGTGKRTTVSQLLEEEIRAFGHDPATYPVIREGPTPSDQFGLSADISRITAETGWHPQVDLKEGLRRMVTWAAGR
ncbi:MAG: NAD-dependent epimerase/dehydratase family protein [Methanomicrobiales archaeon]|nr:NAD-dependent epimerase/dehydratase family protein [Methanomicrobiales archaeon]